MKLHKDSVLYHTSLLTLSSVGLQILGFIYRIGLSRVAGAEAVGVYQLVMPVYSVIQSFTLSGITMAVSTISAERKALGDMRGVQKLVKTGIFLFVITFCITCLPFVLASDSISQSLCQSDECSLALILLLPCLFLTGFENIFKNCFYGVQFVGAPIFSELLEHAVRIGAVLGLLIIFRPATPAMAAAWIVVGMIVGELFSSTALTAIYARTVGRDRRSSKQAPVKSYLMKVGKIAVPVAASGVLNNVIASATTLLIPQRLIASGVEASQAMSAFGVMFGMTFPLLMLPSAFITPLITVIIPRLSKNVALGNTPDLKRKAAKALHVTGLIAAPCMAVLLPLRIPLCQMLYNQPSAAGYFPELVVSTLFLFYQIVTGSILNGVGKQRQACVSVIVSGVIELGMTFALVGNPAFRLLGYVLACMVSSIVGCLMNTIYIKKHVKIKFQLRNWFITPYVSALLAGLLCRFTYNILLGIGISGVLCVLSGILAAVIVYLAALRVQGVDFIHYLRTVFD